MKYLLALIALLAPHDPSYAGTQYESYTIPLAARDCPMVTFASPVWNAPNVPITVPPFNTALGTLVAVDVVFNHTPTWVFGGENTSVNIGTTPVQWSRAYALNVVYRPSFQGSTEWNARNLVGNNPAGSFTGTGQWIFNLDAYDGATDWAGTSGFTWPYANGGFYTAVTNLHETDPLALSAFWQVQAPRTFYISPRFQSATSSGWPSHYLWEEADDIQLHLGSTVTVQYQYQ